MRTFFLTLRNILCNFLCLALFLLFPAFSQAAPYQLSIAICTLSNSIFTQVCAYKPLPEAILSPQNVEPLSAAQVLNLTAYCIAQIPVQLSPHFLNLTHGTETLQHLLTHFLTQDSLVAQEIRALFEWARGNIDLTETPTLSQDARPLRGFCTGIVGKIGDDDEDEYNDESKVLYYHWNNTELSPLNTWIGFRVLKHVQEE